MSNQSNSHRSKDMGAERREIKPVIHGKTVIKKETVGKRFSDLFLAENLSNVKDYIVYDVLVPAVNDTIVNMLTSGVSMMFKGQPSSYRSSSRSRINERTSYGSYYGRMPERDRSYDRKPESYRSSNGFVELGFEERGDAIQVRNEFYNIINNDRYPYVSVQEYYGISNRPELAKFTDTNRGWRAEDIGEIGITRCNDGLYRLDLPRPEHFD